MSFLVCVTSSVGSAPLSPSPHSKFPPRRSERRSLCPHLNCRAGVREVPLTQAASLWLQCKKARLGGPASLDAAGGVTCTRLSVRLTLGPKSCRGAKRNKGGRRGLAVAVLCPEGGLRDRTGCGWRVQVWPADLHLPGARLGCS